MVLPTAWHGAEGVQKTETPITTGFANKETQAPWEEVTAQELLWAKWGHVAYISLVQTNCPPPPSLGRDGCRSG